METVISTGQLPAYNPLLNKTVGLRTIDTPLGAMVACADESGICMLEFADKAALQKELNEISNRFKANIIADDSPVFELLQQELSDYFEGKIKEFTVPISPVGTDFQREVWNILRSIPYGTTKSYQEQANILGHPKAVRAVANANGLNRISIIIPCHRVIGANGKLTGYAGGIWRKEKLLQLEKSVLF